MSEAYRRWIEEPWRRHRDVTRLPAPADAIPPTVEAEEEDDGRPATSV